MSNPPNSKRFKLRTLIVVVAILNVAFALLYYYRASYAPYEVSSAKLESLSKQVRHGMSVHQVSRVMGFAPTRSEMDEQGNGTVGWAFVVDKFRFTKGRWYFADFENGQVINGSIGVFW